MRVLLVEDEEDIAAAVSTGLRHDGYAVDLAPDGPGGVALAEINDYDVLILDLNLPGMDGLEVCQHLRSIRPHLRILMLTARSQVAERIAGLDAGADDYLVKPFALDEVRARLRALLRRGSEGPAALLGLGDLVLDPASRRACVRSRPVDMTRKELSVLDYLLRQPGTVISQEELLEHVWDDAANPFTNTVRVHVLSVRHKLRAAGSSVDVETVIGQGYRLQVKASDGG